MFLPRPRTYIQGTRACRYTRLLSRMNSRRAAAAAVVAVETEGAREEETSRFADKDLIVAAPVWRSL